jgi:hypothetical protein
MQRSKSLPLLVTLSKKEIKKFKLRKVKSAQELSKDLKDEEKKIFLKFLNPLSSTHRCLETLLLVSLLVSVNDYDAMRRLQSQSEK